MSEFEGAGHGPEPDILSILNEGEGSEETVLSLRHSLCSSDQAVEGQELSWGRGG